jgi:hypothetical protein
MMWDWYEWESLESFNAWHDSVKLALGLPKPSHNQASGEIDETVQWTIDYTKAVQVGDVWIAKVENDLSKDLILTELRPRSAAD